MKLFMDILVMMVSDVDEDGGDGADNDDYFAKCRFINIYQNSIYCGL